jgi:hypothetical protein
VYFPNHGWLAFDPTPAAGLSQYDNNWLAALRHFSESVEMFWLENVIGFSANEQASMAFRVQRMLDFCGLGDLAPHCCLYHFQEAPSGIHPPTPPMTGGQSAAEPALRSL